MIYESKTKDFKEFMETITFFVSSLPNEALSYNYVWSDAHAKENLK